MKKVNKYVYNEITLKNIVYISINLFELTNITIRNVNVILLQYVSDYC